MTEFVAWLKEWQDLTGAIVGGLLGGLFTYLGVMLTFRYQSKNDYPKKIITLSEMKFAIQDYEENMQRYYNDVVIGQGNLKVLSKLELSDLKETLLLKAVNVDKVTYRIIIDAFEQYRKFEAITDIVDEQTQSIRFDKSIDAVGGLEIHLPILRNQINNRIAYYEKRI